MNTQQHNTNIGKEKYYALGKYFYVHKKFINNEEPKHKQQ